MAKIFITGSADGLGQMTAKQLVNQGHHVILHARNAARGEEAMQAVPGADRVLIADLSSIGETKNLAAEVNELGKLDAIIHNAGVYKGVEGKISKDGLPLLFAINTLAPYLLTCLIQMPSRLIYMSSDMHAGGDPKLRDLTGGKFGSTYSDTKLHDLMLALAVARTWPDIMSNAVHPGWVPTKMGGSGAPDDLGKGFQTQTWLAVSDDDAAKVSGRYFHHQKEIHFLPEAADIDLQEQLLKICESVSGVPFVISNDVG
jgi:NAD(P)-dependent dehydrogenase (short-subunit alcohol dehydrogenase family)